MRAADGSVTYVCQASCKADHVKTERLAPLCFYQTKAGSLLLRQSLRLSNGLFLSHGRALRRAEIRSVPLSLPESFTPLLCPGFFPLRTCVRAGSPGRTARTEPDYSFSARAFASAIAFSWAMGGHCAGPKSAPFRFPCRRASRRFFVPAFSHRGPASAPGALVGLPVRNRITPSPPELSPQQWPFPGPWAGSPRSGQSGR